MPFFVALPFADNTLAIDAYMLVMLRHIPAAISVESSAVEYQRGKGAAPQPLRGQPLAFL